MEWTLGTNAALISLFYLTLVTGSALCGRCGKYKQACYGGNGKRSDPNFNLSPSSSSAESSIRLAHPSLLTKILISDGDHLTDKDYIPEEAWPKAIQNYLEPEELESYVDAHASKRLEEKTKDNSCRSKLQLALLKIVELRQYVAILEGIVRVSSPDLE